MLAEVVTIQSQRRKGRLEKNVEMPDRQFARLSHGLN
jgi:hypothetical protein